jgi:hypothetical protein
MATLTPQITLTATLLDYQGNQIGTLANPARLRIALCGFGQVLPAIAGTANIARVSSWMLDIPYEGTQITVKLWGNDVISPSGTYYAISVIDPLGNVVQTGIYTFTGIETIDLSQAPQVTQPQVPQAFSLVAKALTGTFPGTVYTVPTQIYGNSLILLLYNGVALRPPTDPNPDYALNSQTVTLNFTTSSGETLYAVYVQALG